MERVKNIPAGVIRKFRKGSPYIRFILRKNDISSVIYNLDCFCECMSNHAFLYSIVIVIQW